MIKCKICNSASNSIIYEGLIRMGKFGSLSNSDYKVYKCNNCEAIFLPNAIEDISNYYETEEYRLTVNGETTDEHYYRLHDSQQIDNFSITGTDIYRDKLVVDIGCGAGAFLDYVNGVARKVVGIEPSSIFQQSLRVKGIDVYSYCSDAIPTLKDSADVCVSFSVLEHIDTPLDFLKEIYALLKHKGKLILSTPNSQDLLLTYLGDDYKRFFYRKAHIWYFTPPALENLLQLAGFKEIKVIPYQRFGLGNFLCWIKEKAPKGDIKYDFLTPAIDTIWKKELERNNVSDYLYVVASKC